MLPGSDSDVTDAASDELSDGRILRHRAWAGSWHSRGGGASVQSRGVAQRRVRLRKRFLSVGFLCGERLVPGMLSLRRITSSLSMATIHSGHSLLCAP